MIIDFVLYMFLVNREFYNMVNNLTAYTPL